MGCKRARAFGFYVPYRHAEQVRAPGPEDVVEWFESVLLDRRQELEGWLAAVESYDERLRDFARADPADVNRPRFDQDWFPGLDGAIAYTFVRRLKPRTIIEVGSGHSTRFMAQAIRDEGLSTRLCSVDPKPRRRIDELCDVVVRQTVEATDPSLFDDLAAGDFLFIDSSHVAMPGTDVDRLFTRVLPRLRRGVVVHLHDVFLPHGYPRAWAWRGYNEQNVLLAMLGAGRRYEIMMANAFARRRYRKRIDATAVRRPEGAFESSCWLRVREGAGEGDD